MPQSSVGSDTSKRAYIEKYSYRKMANNPVATRTVFATLIWDFTGITQFIPENGNLKPVATRTVFATLIWDFTGITQPRLKTAGKQLRA